MTETARLRIPLLAAAQAQKHVTVNEGWLVADTLVNGSVLGFADAPAGGESDGDCYIVGSGTAAFTGWDGRIARLQDGVWHSLLPGAGDGVGWIIWNQDDSQLYVCLGAGTWEPVFGLHDAMVFKGVVDCSGNPNYPAADRGWTYRVSVAGRIGGGAGPVVEAGDLLICLTDGTSADDHATVGANWAIVQANLDGVVIGPASVTDGLPAVFDGATGKLIKETTYSAFKTSLALAKADVGLGAVRDVPQREQLTASRNYYVRTDGSDANDGLANTSGGAFLTIQKAIDAAAALDLATYSVTIWIGNGTYTQGLILRSFVGGGTITLRGDTATPSNVVINPTGATCITADNVTGTWVVRGVKLTATTSGNGILATGASNIIVYEIEFGSFGASFYHMNAQRGGLIYPQTAYTISGGGQAHMYADLGGLVFNTNKTVTLTGTFAFTNFVFGRRTGVVLASGLTFAGTYTVTGVRYSGLTNAVIDTAGGGASYFPGDSAGSVATGAQYA